LSFLPAGHPKKMRCVEGEIKNTGHQCGLLFLGGQGNRQEDSKKKAFLNGRESKNQGPASVHRSKKGACLGLSFYRPRKPRLTNGGGQRIEGEGFRDRKRSVS